MKNFIENMKEFKKTKYGNVILFFGFYLIFFIVIICLVRFNGRDGYRMQDYEKGRPKGFDSSSIMNKNFYFDYNVTLDGVNHNYYGKKKDDIESFKYNTNDYYRNGEGFFIKNDSWTNCNNPYVMSELIEPESIVKIIGGSSFSTKEVEDDKKYIYNYLISTNTINKLIYDVDSDFDEVPNKLTIVVDMEARYQMVTIELNGFCKLTNKCNELTIKNKYEMFNSVKSIDNPV